MLVRLPFCLMVILLAACEKHEAVESLGEFEVPFQPDGQRTYTYLRQPGNDTLVHTYLFSSSAERSYTQRIDANGDIHYERYYRYQGNYKELVKEYYYEPQVEGYFPSYQKLAGDIKDYRPIDLGKKYKGLKANIWFTDQDGFRTVIKEEDTAVEETEIAWQGRTLPALKFTYTASMKKMIKYLPFLKRGEETEGAAWYASGIGLIENRYRFDKVEYVMKLISIDTTSFPSGVSRLGDSAYSGS